MLAKPHIYGSIHTSTWGKFWLESYLGKSLESRFGLQAAMKCSVLSIISCLSKCVHQSQWTESNACTSFAWIFPIHAMLVKQRLWNKETPCRSKSHIVLLPDVFFSFISRLAQCLYNHRISWLFTHREMIFFKFVSIIWLGRGIAFLFIVLAKGPPVTQRVLKKDSELLLELLTPSA